MPIIPLYPRWQLEYMAHAACSPQYKPSGIQNAPIYTWRNYEFTWMVCKFTVIRSLITVRFHGLNRNTHIADSLFKGVEKEGFNSFQQWHRERLENRWKASVYTSSYTLIKLPWKRKTLLLGRSLLLNYQKTMTPMWPVKPVLRKQTFRVKTRGARNCIFLKIPPIQF
jgi:hypothetical protein